jgi:hypothetical protein
VTDSWEDATDKECLEVGLLGAGRVDPFASFPIASQPYMHVLIDHCEFEFEKKWIKQRWKANIVQISPNTAPHFYLLGNGRA